jgi:hypothetical protein
VLPLLRCCHHAPLLRAPHALLRRPLRVQHRTRRSDGCVCVHTRRRGGLRLLPLLLTLQSALEAIAVRHSRSLKLDKLALQPRHDALAHRVGRSSSSRATAACIVAVTVRVREHQQPRRRVAGVAVSAARRRHLQHQRSCVTKTVPTHDDAHQRTAALAS